MLSVVCDLLGERGWFDISLPFEKSIHLTRGHCLWMVLTRRGVMDTHVKFSDCLNLQAEAARCAAASQSYPGLAPSFVGYARHGGIDMLVSRAVDSTAIDPNGLRDVVLAGLGEYFSAMPRALAASAAPSVDNRALLDTVAHYFAAHPLASLARRWLDPARIGPLSALPAMPQHGDFVLNNLGRRPDGRLVVFDWEDYGTVSLPGLDLFTLELSLADHSGMSSGPRGRAADRPLARAACEAMGLPAADYDRLAPLYALVFRYLKRNYGPEVRQRMDREISGLAGAVA